MKDKHTISWIMALIVSISVMLVFVVVILVGGVVFVIKNPDSTFLQQTTQKISSNSDAVRTTTDVKSPEALGLKDGAGVELVVRNCTGCHSAKLITQNRMDKDRWKSTIRWMQKTQNLWDLGDNEELILDYLASQYGAVAKGRRSPLTNVTWYKLKE